MSKQDSQSMQSLPVDDVKPNETQQFADGEQAADAVAGDGQASSVTSDPASAQKASDAGVSSSAPAATSSKAAVAAKTSGKILGMSRHVFAALVAVVVVGGAVVTGVVATQQPAPDEWFDANAKQGQFEGKSEEEIKAALNEQIEKGMMNISIAAAINFADGSSEGEARIENIAANPMDQKIVITLNDTGEVIYESGALAPDQHIQNIKLMRDLDPGKYPATATFTGYDRETHKKTGQAAAEIVLNVEG